MKQLGYLLIALLLGMASGVGLSYFHWNSQLTALQDHSDSVAIASSAIDSSLRVRIKVANDSLKKLAARKPTVIIQVASSAVDSLARDLVVAKSAADSIPLLVGQVSQLQIEVASLKSSITIGEAETRVWQIRALKAERDVHDLNGQIQDLNGRLQALHAPPGLAIKILKGASYVVTAIVAYEVGKKKG